MAVQDVTMREVEDGLVKWGFTWDDVSGDIQSVWCDNRATRAAPNAALMRVWLTSDQTVMFPVNGPKRVTPIPVGQPRDETLVPPNIQNRFKLTVAVNPRTGRASISNLEWQTEFPAP
jgi:hypothetical protein